MIIHSLVVLLADLALEILILADLGVLVLDVLAIGSQFRDDIQERWLPAKRKMVLVQPNNCILNEIRTL